MPKNDVIHEPNDFVVRIGNREVRDVDSIISDEMFEQIRQGYRCIKCMQVFEAAFPEECPFPICRFPVRREQSFELLKAYKGRDEEIGRDPFEDADDERTLWEKKGIWIPPRR